jgi:segregation and condensation protein B
MNLETEVAMIEAILHLESEPLDIRTLQRISQLSKEAVVGALAQLRDELGKPIHGLELVEIADGYSLAPKQELAPALRERYGRRNDARLSRAAMETLSIVAYSQPITRAEIENLRGVNADGMVRLLLSRNLIREVGHKDAPGKPVQYGTTREFLKLFRLGSIADLPKLTETDEQRFARDE